jgi:DNA replication and repair protein RecF
VQIHTLNITSLRNIVQAKIECSPRFNLFFGDNAAGKTSILEAIYYLSSGKSFRTHHHDRIIHIEHDHLTLFSQLQFENSLLPIGMRRFRNGMIQIHIANDPVSSVAEISRYLPVQFIGSDSHRILSDGPKYRRQFLDWGLFHIDPQFFTHWKAFQKLLIQRNAALKARASKDELLVWNRIFAVSGEELNMMRQHYVNEFTPIFMEIISILLPDINLSIDYSQGWDQGVTLETCLNQNASRETYAGHALFGPQRADLNLSVEELPAQDALSQGQQKLVSYALKLAQGLHLYTSTGKAPVYLIDDLPSELDSQKRSLVTSILSSLNCQVFITGISSHDLDELMDSNDQNSMFHVKHGTILSQKTEKCFT